MADIIYRIPGKNRGPRGTTYDSRGVESADNLPDGWHASMSDAVAAHLDPPKRKRKSKKEQSDE